MELYQQIEYFMRYFHYYKQFTRQFHSKTKYKFVYRPIAKMELCFLPEHASNFYFKKENSHKLLGKNTQVTKHFDMLNIQI